MYFQRVSIRDFLITEGRPFHDQLRLKKGVDLVQIYPHPNVLHISLEESRFEYLSPTF